MPSFGYRRSGLACRTRAKLIIMGLELLLAEEVLLPPRAGNPRRMEDPAPVVEEPLLKSTKAYEFWDTSRSESARSSNVAVESSVIMKPLPPDGCCSDSKWVGPSRRLSLIGIAPSSSRLLLLSFIMLIVKGFIIPGPIPILPMLLCMPWLPPNKLGAEKRGAE